MSSSCPERIADVRGFAASRFADALAVAALLLPSGALAQAWALEAGVAARGEYTDNYFFTADDRQSAFTATVAPFLTAARRTEASDVTAVLAIGGNRVWGPSPTTDYASGRASIDGSWQDERSKWIGALSYVRSPSLQTQVVADGSVLLGLAYTNAASANGAYTYALDERWTAGVNASIYDNHYSGVSSGTSFSDNHGYYAGGTLAYAYSQRTQATLAAGYSYYSSDLSRSDSVTATLGVVHQFSPQLTLSGTFGGFWSDTTAAQNALVCPVAQAQCDVGLVQPVAVTTNDRQRATGWLYGGQLAYALSEQTQFSLSLTESLSPSGSGALSKSDYAGATLSYRFSERLTGRLGASYTRTSFPQVQTSSFNNNYIQGEAGISYQLAERWSLEAGYRYARAQYSQNSLEPKSNLGFVSIAYNWPGTSYTGWVGKPSDVQGPAAGPLTLPETPRAPATPGVEGDRSMFDPYTIP